MKYSLKIRNLQYLSYHNTSWRLWQVSSAVWTEGGWSRRPVGDSWLWWILHTPLFPAEYRYSCRPYTGFLLLQIQRNKYYLTDPECLQITIRYTATGLTLDSPSYSYGRINVLLNPRSPQMLTFSGTTMVWKQRRTMIPIKL